MDRDELILNTVFLNYGFFQNQHFQNVKNQWYLAGSQMFSKKLNFGDYICKKDT